MIVCSGAVLAASLVLPWAPLAEAKGNGVRAVGVETITAGREGSWKVAANDGATLVTRLEHGRSMWSSTLAGSFRLPVVTTRGRTAGPSADGSALVLAASRVPDASLVPEERAAGSDPQSSRFAIVRQGSAHELTLRGAWAFDAVSPDARTLYMIESVGDNRYWVRKVDAATGAAKERLTAKTISADQRQTGVDDDPMEGVPLDRVVSLDQATVFTLYDGPGHPFVHALNVVQGYALCYDLPRSMKPDVRALRLRLSTSGQAGQIDVIKGARRVVAHIVSPDDRARRGPELKLVSARTAPLGSQHL